MHRGTIALDTDSFHNLDPNALSRLGLWSDQRFYVNLMALNNLLCLSSFSYHGAFGDTYTF